MEASKTQGRTRGRKGEGKRYLIPYIYIFFCHFCTYTYAYLKTHSLTERASGARSAQTCAGEMVPGQVPPVQVLQEDFLQNKTPNKSGSDSSTPSNGSEEPAT